MEQKKSKKKPRKYDADFKREVLKMVESGRPVPDISRSLGVGSNLIYTWVKRAKLAPGDKILLDDSLSLDAEKIALHKRVRELEMERDILKKALGIFSRPI